MTLAKPLGAQQQRRVLIPFALVALIWGSTWTVIRDQLGTVPASWSVCYRFAIAAAAMFAVARLTRSRLRFSLAEHGIAIGLAATTFFGSFNLVYRAEAHITSGLVAVCFALLFLFNAVLGWIFLRERMSRPFLIGSTVAVIGVGLMFVHEFRADGHDEADTALGMALTFVAVGCASVSNVMQGAERARALPMASMLAWGMLWGTVIDGVYAWVVDGPPTIETRPAYLFGILYLGLIASAVAYTLYYNMIRVIGAARGGYVNTLVPVLAMSLSTVLEGYRWSAVAAAGGLLTVVGLIIALRARLPAKA